MRVWICTKQNKPRSFLNGLEFWIETFIGIHCTLINFIVLWLEFCEHESDFNDIQW